MKLISEPKNPNELWCGECKLAGVFTEAQKKQMTLKIRISDPFKMFPATESISHSSGYIVESRMHIRSPMVLKITNGI